ncbi:MAG: EAL domain-containing protein [Desmonostoc vinosum HA7617-LM4]|jgi:diguanylate cyclase (GGDEF)-like protein|nr:EAL domain-containing protein [Desmonostoc vinosum HA7617-LM4]
MVLLMLGVFTCLGAKFLALCISKSLWSLKNINFDKVSKNDKSKAKKTRKRTKRIALNSSDRYLDALVKVESSLLTFDGSTNCYIKVLQILGKVCRANRIYICEVNNHENDNLEIHPKAEWCAKGMQLRSDNFCWQNLADKCFSHWLHRLVEGNIITDVVTEFSKSEREILEQQGVKTILTLPIIVKDQFIGFISFDDCIVAQAWEVQEITFLQAVVGALSLANERLLVEDAIQTVIFQNKNFTSQLENTIWERTAKLHAEIAERQRVQAELEKLLSLQQATLESANDGILLLDSQGKITGFNQKFIQIWGIPESLMKSGNYKQALRVALKQLEKPRKYLARIKEIYLTLEAQTDDSNDAIAFQDGRVFELYSQPQCFEGKIIGRVWSFHDVTAYKYAEAKIRYQASHDSLTNLPNRLLFNEQLAESLTQACQSGKNLAVCFLDLDRFKTINNTLGHVVGDQLLQNVAQRLTTCLRSGDAIARWGGDEFILILHEISDAKDAAYIQERILAAFKTGFNIENHCLHISASVGVALYPIHGEDAETLVKHADAALYRVKLQGRNNYQVYNSAINSHTSELLILENSLHYALERQEFEVYYQPQVKTSTGEIPTMEALLRWQHPELGLIPPEKFIPLAEETGLIVPIGEWVLRTACAQNKAWQETFGLSSLSVAVNLSVRQFKQPDLVNMVAQILSETKLKPHYLELEITESVAMQNIALTKAILSELCNLGVSLSIDDFGTGYCSLSYLKNFPIHSLKIDRSFVRDLTSDTNDAAITTAIIALAHGLNLAVVAEGVETEEQRNLLRVIECELMQGHLFSHPVSAEDASILLRKWKSHKINTTYLVA